MTVQELDLSVRANNCLESAKIQTVRDLVKKTDADLLKVRSFGKTSLREVKRRFGRHGSEPRDGSGCGADRAVRRRGPCLMTMMTTTWKKKRMARKPAPPVTLASKKRRVVGGQCLVVSSDRLN
jgi:hypothetical protein